MVARILLHLTTFLSSIGLGSWLGGGSGSEVARSSSGRSYNDGGWTLPEPDFLTLTNELETWMAQPEDAPMDDIPYHLKQAITALNSSSAPSTTFKRSPEANNNRVTDRISGSALGFTYCGACHFLAKVVVGYAHIGAPINILTSLLVKICYAIAYNSMEVCRGIIYQDTDRVQWILQNSPATGDEICALMLGDRGCGEYMRTSWKVPLPPRPSYIQHPTSSPNNYPTLSTSYSASFPSYSVSSLHKRDIEAQKPETPISNSNGKKTLKVLHLTDVHYDPDYIAGSNAVCDAPLCCNGDSGVPKEASHRAGRWGDYRTCDSPKWLLVHMLNHIKAHHPDIDYVLCSGDLVPHHIWKISARDNVAIIKEMSQILQSFFPNIPMFGAIGNHESYPRDSFPPPEVSEVWSKFGVQWLYDAMAERWSRMMGRPAPPSASYGGFYSVLARPGLRLISLNTNYCYRLNWWVLYKSVDPGLMLTWLVNELSGAEARGELVHIIGHIPPYYIDCFAQWGHQYSRIIDRFSHIIRGQFFGHSHMDEFRIHYGAGHDGVGRKRPISVQYITPNNGPFDNLNPSYRVFYIDGDHPRTTREVLDYDTWVMNLTHANLHDEPHWYRLYSARRDLNLPSLHPRHWHNLVDRMSRDHSLFHKYYRYQVQDSDTKLAMGCDVECRHKTLCSIVDGNRLAPSKCRRGTPPH